MSYIEKEKLIKADIASIENRVRHAFNQGYDLGFKDGKERANPLKQEPMKRALANIHIEQLTSNMIGYMQGYVGDCNCPYEYKLLGAEGLKKPTKCGNCENCKYDFWIDLEATLLDKYVVE